MADLLYHSMVLLNLQVQSPTLLPCCWMFEEAGCCLMVVVYDGAGTQVGPAHPLISLS